MKPDRSCSFPSSSKIDFSTFMARNPEAVPGLWITQLLSAFPLLQQDGTAPHPSWIHGGGFVCDSHEVIHREDRTLTCGEIPATQSCPLLLILYKHKGFFQMHAVQGDKKTGSLFATSRLRLICPLPTGPQGPKFVYITPMDSSLGGPGSPDWCMLVPSFSSFPGCAPSVVPFRGLGVALQPLILLVFRFLCRNSQSSLQPEQTSF